MSNIEWGGGWKFTACNEVEIADCVFPGDDRCIGPECSGFDQETECTHSSYDNESMRLIAATRDTTR